MAQVGRPSAYSTALCAEICERIANGESARGICRDDDMPSFVTVLSWLDKYPEFLSQYERARMMQADALVEEALEIVDDGSNDWMERFAKDNPDQAIGWQLNGEAVQRSRLRADHRRWWAAKLQPKKYGEKQAVELSGSVSFKDVGDEDLLTELLELVATGVVKLPEGVSIEAAPQDQPEADDWSEFA